MVGKWGHSEIGKGGRFSNIYITDSFERSEKFGGGGKTERRVDVIIE